MRIIGGKHRGRVLTEFKGEAIRPTADRVKESVFNILSRKIAGARVLDLFCGSGALGLECISRGAKEAVFNDCSKDSVAVLTANIKKLGEGEVCTVRALDYLACLSALQGKFDIVFLVRLRREGGGRNRAAGAFSRGRRDCVRTGQAV